MDLLLAQVLCVENQNHLLDLTSADTNTLKVPRQNGEVLARGGEQAHRFASAVVW
jgi:hypothetical protein